MITHFTYQPFLSGTSRQRDYRFSFFYKGEKISGIYHYDGSIDWDDHPDDEEKLAAHVHGLMLFHVYDV
ncbi:DUF5342 family protein [Camelliibacillus cellulosilyticus]|uniref:DUF5342 family protein n=1 Tax=Camelliibacillus cellulosilyticus TaxID=2174486 RepID=UPI00366C8028